MWNIKHFLQSSTIHGLPQISTSRKYARLFWILVVIAGFTGAGFLISKSFTEWNDNPVTTTIETLSISDIAYPKVIVCPPKHAYTNLNLDLMMVGNMTIDKNTIYQ